MPRMKCKRRISGVPGANIYKPAGIPLRLLEAVEIGHDEWEAVRLADLEKLYHEVAAEKMGISRQTFGRILESARGKIADALVNGKSINILTNNHDKNSCTNAE